LWAVVHRRLRSAKAAVEQNLCWVGYRPTSRPDIASLAEQLPLASRESIRQRILSFSF